jgi:hypothetical protein
MLNLTEEQFEEQFTPQINHIERAMADVSVADEDICSFGGCMYETTSPDIDYVLEMAKENRVVTIIEGKDTIGEDGEPHSTLFYSSGYHLVNRLGFLVLDKPYTEDFEVKLDW